MVVPKHRRTGICNRCSRNVREAEATILLECRICKQWLCPACFHRDNCELWRWAIFGMLLFVVIYPIFLYCAGAE